MGRACKKRRTGEFGGWEADRFKIGSSCKAYDLLAQVNVGGKFLLAAVIIESPGPGMVRAAGNARRNEASHFVLVSVIVLNRYCTNDRPNYMAWELM